MHIAQHLSLPSDLVELLSTKLVPHDKKKQKLWMINGACPLPARHDGDRSPSTSHHQMAPSSSCSAPSYPDGVMIPPLYKLLITEYFLQHDMHKNGLKTIYNEIPGRHQGSLSCMDRACVCVESWVRVSFCHGVLRTATCNLGDENCNLASRQTSDRIY